MKPRYLILVITLFLIAAAVLLINFSEKLRLNIVSFIVSRILSKDLSGDLKVEEGGKKISYQAPEGEYSYEQGTLPPGFPEDFPIFPEAVISSSWTADSESAKGMSVIWESKDSPEKIFDFYKSQLETSGWKILEEHKVDNGYAVSFEKEKTAGFVGITKKDEAVTVISLTLGLKEK